MRHGIIRRGAVRRIVGPALATMLLAFGACSDDNNNSTGPSTREYNQVQRLGIRRS